MSFLSLRILLTATTLAIAANAIAEEKPRYRFCRELMSSTPLTNTLKKHVSAFRLTPDGVVVDQSAQVYARQTGIQHFSSEIAHTFQFGDGKAELSLLQIDDLGGEPRRFTVGESSPDFSNGITTRFTKFHFEFRHGICVPARVERMVQSGQDFTLETVSDFDRCLNGERRMCEFIPNHVAIRAALPTDHSVDIQIDDGDSSPTAR